MNSKSSKALAEDAFDRLGQKSLHIASYHYDGNKRVISRRHGMPFEPVVTYWALKLNPWRQGFIHSFRD